MRLRPVSVLILLCTLLAPPALAADLYVYPDGGGTYATIQDAVDAAGSGDTVWLMEGVFSGSGNCDVEIFGNITLRGDGAADACVIDCGGDSRRGLILESCTVTIRDLTITGGRSTSGGALWLTESNLTVEDCALYDNAATADGGAIWCDDGSTLSLLRCALANNRAGDDGGAIFATGGSGVTLSRCTLADNMATGGSGVFLENDATCDIESAIIAFGRGGAACSNYYADNFTLTYTDLWSNAGGDWTEGAAGQSGNTGNTHMEPRLCDPLAPVPDLRLSEYSPCDGIGPYGFIGCGAAGAAWPNPVYGLRPDGSGMFDCIQDALDAVAPSAVICLEDGEYAGVGNRELDLPGRAVTLCSRGDDREAILPIVDGYRTLLLDGDEGDDTVIRGLRFDGYDADGASGGAVHVTGPSGARFENCLFIGFNSEASGLAFLIEAIPADPATIAISGCKFDDLQADDHGGTIRAAGWNGEIDDCEFHSGFVWRGADGGFIHLTDYTDFAVRNCLFSCGAATGSGGTLHLTNGAMAQVEISGCEFVNINAELHGGGIHLENAGQVHMIECDFPWAKADGDGGCVHAIASVPQQTLTVENCYLNGWGAPGYPSANRGGGIHVENLESVTISESHFDTIEAVDAGGGLYVMNSTVTIHDCLFNDNRADKGAAAYLEQSIIDISESEIRSNVGTYCGGIDAMHGSQGSISSCWFRQNRAAVCSALRLYGVGDYDVEDCVFWGNVNGEDITTLVMQSRATFTSCTWHGNYSTGDDPLQSQIRVTMNGDAAFDYCIVSGGDRAMAAYSEDADITLFCCDLWGNEYGDWVGDIADQFSEEGNLSVAPLYCNGSVGNLSLNESSPCLAENNVCGYNIGRYGQGCMGGVGVEETAPVVTVPTLRPNFPNPFNPATTIAYDLPAACDVSLRIVDVEGRLIATLRDGRAETAGAHAVVWRGRDAAGNALPSGFYFAVLSADGVESTQRMLLLK